MKLKEFIDMYDYWGGTTVINNNNLSMIVRDFTYNIAEDDNFCDMEVVSFGFYDNELCVRVK